MFLLLCLGYGWTASEVPLDFWSQQEAFNARSLPLMIAAAGSLVSILLILSPAERTDWDDIKNLSWMPGLMLVALLAAYSLSLEFLGFILSTVLFLVGGFATLGERKPMRMVLVAIPLAVCFWLMLDLLGVRLGPGLLFEQLMGGQDRD